MRGRSATRLLQGRVHLARKHLPSLERLTIGRDAVKRGRVAPCNGNAACKDCTDPVIAPVIHPCTAQP